MLKIFYHKKAQSFLEYTMLVLIVTASIIAMQKYMQRSINARLRQVQVELNESKR